MIVYLDPSVLVAFWTGETSGHRLRGWLRENDSRLKVSDFAKGEFVSAIGNKVRARRIDEAAAIDTLLAFDAWFAARLVEFVSSEDIVLATEVVRRFELGIRLPDAIHIAIARRLGATLVSLDKRQVRGAGAVGVSAFDPIDQPGDSV